VANSCDAASALSSISTWGLRARALVGRYQRRSQHRALVEDPDRESPHGTEVNVGADLEAEAAGVGLQGLVLVEGEDGREVVGREHEGTPGLMRPVTILTVGPLRPGRVIRSCTIGRGPRFFVSCPLAATSSSKPTPTCSPGVMGAVFLLRMKRSVARLKRHVDRARLPAARAWGGRGAAPAYLCGGPEPGRGAVGHLLLLLPRDAVLSGHQVLHERVRTVRRAALDGDVAAVAELVDVVLDPPGAAGVVRAVPSTSTSHTMASPWDRWPVASAPARQTEAV